MTELAIVIVSYNTREELEACLTALHDHPPARAHRIVVVDNDSADGSAATVRTRWPAVTVIDAGANLGFARATNLGIRATRSRLVLLLNSDAVAPPGAIDRLVEELDRRGAAVAGPRLVDGDGRLEVSFGPMISPWGELWQRALVTAHRRGVWPLAGLVERRARRSRPVAWVSGACLLVAREVADAVGLLDERYFLYTEDVDFCAAVRAAGRQVWFIAPVEVRHRRGRSRRHAPAAAEHAYRRSQIAFYRKHHPALVPLLRLYLRIRGRLPPQDVRGAT